MLLFFQWITSHKIIYLHFHVFIRFLFIGSFINSLSCSSTFNKILLWLENLLWIHIRYSIFTATINFNRWQRFNLPINLPLHMWLCTSVQRWYLVNIILLIRVWIYRSVWKVGLAHHFWLNKSPTWVIWLWLICNVIQSISRSGWPTCWVDSRCLQVINERVIFL